MQEYLISKCVGDVDKTSLKWSLQPQIDNGEKKYKNKMDLIYKRVMRMKPNITTNIIVKNSYESYLVHNMCKKYDKIKTRLQYIVCNDIAGLIASYCTTRKKSESIIDLNQQYSKIDRIEVDQCCYACSVEKKFITSKHPRKYVRVKSFK
jgi:hypothetical protein